MRVDAQDDLIVVGNYEGEDASIGRRPSAGAGDAFAVKYDTFGNVLWAKGFGGVGIQTANAVGTDAQSYVYVAGTFERQIPLSSGTLKSAGRDDIFVVKLAP